MLKESVFEKNLCTKIKSLFPGAIILKTDPNFINGFPDRLSLIGNSWFAFEAKAHESARKRPNQDYYINMLNDMSLARFVYPENEREFLDEILATFRFTRTSRLFRG